MNWKKGDQIVQYETWGGEIGTARPVTVVENSPDRIAFYTHPGVQFVTRGIENRRSMSFSERMDLFTRALDPNFGDFRPLTSPDRHVLAICPPEAWFSVLLFWSIDWQFKFWYVNLQTPLQKSRLGVASQDCALDIVVRPDMTWEWKDADEFEALVARGFFTREEVSSVRSAADRIIAEIENRGAPFNEGWEEWRPDEDWPVPLLPDDWHRLTGWRGSDQ